MNNSTNFMNASAVPMINTNANNNTVTLNTHTNTTTNFVTANQSNQFLCGPPSANNPPPQCPPPPPQGSTDNNNGNNGNGDGNNTCTTNVNDGSNTNDAAKTVNGSASPGPAGVIPMMMPMPISPGMQGGIQVEEQSFKFSLVTSIYLITL